MVEIFLKKEGIIVDINHFQKNKYPYLELYLKILNILLNRVKIIKDIDVEVNLIEYGKLGNELVLDCSLNTDIIKENLDSINNLGAIAIYYVGLHGGFLLEKYKDQRICYIQLQQTNEINMIRIAFHEIQHFSDPFIPREWQDILEDGLVYVNYEKTIKAYIRLGLNEYCANLYAFSECLDLINKITKNKLNDSLIETYKEVLIEKIPSYISNLSNELSEFIGVLKSGEIDNISIQNPKAEIINFLWSEFFKTVYYFLGGWKVYEDKELDTRLIQKTWDIFISKMQNFELHNMIILLNSFKNLLLEDFESNHEMVNRVEHLFFKYYLGKLELDFISLL